MARRKKSRRPAPRRARRASPRRIVRRARRRAAVAFAPRRRRRSSGGGGGLFVARGGVVDTLKANAVPAAVAAAGLAVGATLAGMVARKLAPRLNTPTKLGLGLAALGIVGATMARKFAGGGAVGRAVQFAGLGVVTDGLMRATAPLRARMAAGGGGAAPAPAASTASNVKGLPAGQRQPSTAAILARMAG